MEAATNIVQEEPACTSLKSYRNVTNHPGKFHQGYRTKGLKCRDRIEKSTKYDLKGLQTQEGVHNETVT